MPPCRRSRRLFALLLLLATAPAAAQVTVSGVVRDPADGLPVRGVRVALAAWLGGYSDRDGRFTIPAPPGRFVPRVSCPRTGQSELVADLPPIEVGDSSMEIGVSFAGSRDCLPALEAASHGEFRGVLRGGVIRLLELCDGPSYQVALELTAEMARELARRFSSGTDPRKTTVTLTIRGTLEGPGFFGQQGAAHYLLTAESIRAARIGTAAAACPR